MDDDVGAVLDRAEQVRRAEGVVHGHGDAVRMGDLRDGVDVGDVGIRVAERFDEDEPGGVSDGGFDFCEVPGIHERRVDAERRQRVLEQVGRAAVDGLLRDHVVAAVGESLDDVGDRRRAGCHGKPGHASFERRDAVFEDALGGIGQASVDVAGIAQPEAVGGVLRAAEDVRRGLVDGHRAGVGCGISLFLSDMQGLGLESVFSHGSFLRMRNRSS